VDAALRAIADPSRRTILRLVRDRELPAGEIARHFPLSRPAVSQHLRVLKDAGLLVERRDAQRRLYRADEPAVDRLVADLRGFWDDRLGRLKDEAEAIQRRRNDERHRD
jgi:DNA-binding transcriptional ArsR family regulator